MQKSIYKEQSVADGTPQTDAEDIKAMQAPHKNLIVCTHDIKRQTLVKRQSCVKRQAHKALAHKMSYDVLLQVRHPLYQSTIQHSQASTFSISKETNTQLNTVTTIII